MDVLLPRRPEVRRLFCWAGLILWASMIWLLSSQPNLEISDRDTLDLVLRKLGHMLEFGCLFLLASMTLRQEGLRHRSYFAAAVVATSYAAVDEYHQTFVAGRSGHPRDVLIDCIGITLAWWGARTLHTRRAQ